MNPFVRILVFVALYAFFSSVLLVSCGVFPTPAATQAADQAGDPAAARRLLHESEYAAGQKYEPIILTGSMVAAALLAFGFRWSTATISFLLAIPIYLLMQTAVHTRHYKARRFPDLLTPPAASAPAAPATPAIAPPKVAPRFSPAVTPSPHWVNPLDAPAKR